MLANELGLSGSNLEIIGSVVRKTSPKSTYNNRLIKQLEKQNFFSKLIFTYISTPLIVTILLPKIKYHHININFLQNASFQT